MACHSTLAAGFARFLAGPLVGRALLVGRLATLAGNLALFHAIHRGESAILFSHTSLPDSLRCLPVPYRAGETPSVPGAAARLSGPPRGPTAPHIRRRRTARPSVGAWLQRMCHGSRVEDT